MQYLKYHFPPKSLHHTAEGLRRKIINHLVLFNINICYKTIPYLPTYNPKEPFFIPSCLVSTVAHFKLPTFSLDISVNA